MRKSSLRSSCSRLGIAPALDRSGLDAKADGISTRTLERARARLKCQANHPAQLPDRLGEDAYAALSDEERRTWWLALPEFPDAPPAKWTS